MASKKETLKIFSDLTDFKSAYENDQIELIPGLYFSQWRTLRMCEYYSNSTYLGNMTIGVAGSLTTTSVGKNKDLGGRDKPFYNIVNYRVLLAKTATDLDIKDIQVTADDPAHWVKAMFLNKEAYKWMKDKDVNFSLTLNRMGNNRPKYGGYLLKRTMVKGKLYIDVLDWKNVVTDQNDILNNPIIETHFMSSVELKAKDGVWKNVVDVLKLNKSENKGKTPKIIVHEVLGEFPIATYKEAARQLGEEGEAITESDEYTYTLQKYFIAEVKQTKKLLYCEDKGTKEKISDTYEYLAWEEMPGRALGRGVIEDSEEAQVWTNDAVINEKNAMDLAGKVVMKTTSKTLANNVLEVENGKIFELKANEELDTLQLNPAALGEFENQISRWKIQADSSTNSYDATTGKQPPADTPFSQTQLLNQIGMKPFDYKREEWGIHLSVVFDKWILPYLIKKLYEGHTLASDFTDDELAIIDRDFATGHMNRIVKETAINTGKVPTQGDFEQGVQTIMQSRKGRKRYIEFPDGYFDDVEAGITVITTGEQKNKAAMLTSLSAIFQMVTNSYNQQTGKFMVLEDPKLAAIFGNILELAGAGIDPTAMGISMQTLNGSKAPDAPVPALPANPAGGPQANPQQTTAPAQIPATLPGKRPVALK